ncbi:MAG: radical SAM family heme chaperone HemW [Campylobacterota bacterium]|nr:radical SAM family heme chaperone HemW [Campylobacterota bacterium]
MLLYIHIPFCDSKCFYCAFNSYTSLHSLRDEYMVALEKQLKYELEKNSKKNNINIETVFIGGGTPSTIDAQKYKKIIETIKPYIKNQQTNNIEITIEANPNSASKQWLEDIYSIGINRISFGVQSFNDEKLEFLGRNHNNKQAIEAIKNANKVGFKNINCDIIYDTKLDTKKLLDNDLNIIKTLPINHLSAYSLTLEEGTKFYNKCSVKVENIDLANYLFKELKSLGFNQYEISNFAKNDYAKSKHNLGYWQYKEYLGIGCGAVGCYDGKRYYGQKDVQTYINNPIRYENKEELTPNDILVEKVLLGFRSEIGVKIEIFNDIQKEKIYELVNLNKLKIENNIIYSLDFMLADELCLYLDI